jgi:tetratricopeptide (TPR) repeat protein
MPRINRGMSLARTDPATAIRDLTSVLAEDPGLLMARRTIAVAYEAAGQYARAIEILRALEKEGQLTVEDAIVLGDNLRFAGRLPEAVAVLERTARENPKFPQPWLSLAEVHIKEGRNAEAAAAYEHVLTLVPDHIEALRGLGDIALLEGRLDAASSRYDRILEVDPRGRGGDDQGRRPAHAGRPRGGGDRALPPRGGARARERGGAAVPGGRAVFDRPPRGSGAALRARPGRGPTHDDDPQRPRPHAPGPRRSRGRRGRAPRVAAPGSGAADVARTLAEIRSGS